MTFLPGAEPVWGTRPTPTAQEPEPLPRAERPRRRGLAIILSLLFVGASAGAWYAVSGWRDEVASLRVQATDLGQQVAALRADRASLERESALLSEQNSQGLAWIESLTVDNEPVLSRTADITAAAGALDQCAADWGSLVDQLWTSSASSLANLEHDISDRCDAAIAELNRLIPEGWVF